MLDFLLIKHRQLPNKGVVEVYPDFIVSRSKDLMIRGGTFYAIWNFETDMWSTDEYDVQLLVDKLLREYRDRLKVDEKLPIIIRSLSNYSSNSWSMWKTFISKLADQSAQLDNKITFLNSDVRKSDHVSRRLEYPLEDNPTPAFDKLFKTLYSKEELTKIMWAIGAIINGGSKTIQKFFVLFGPPGSGKSTTLNLIQLLFPGYTTSFEAQSLISGTSAFSTEMFRENPLIGINHEGDLSRVKDNSLLNSIVSHDSITMNVKYKTSYPLRLNTTLFVATNKPVSITDAKSGLIRRLIDIRPTGERVPSEQYDDLMSQIEFELGAIAFKSLTVYTKMGKDHYNSYKPLDMMLRTNVIFNFVDEYFYEFQRDDFITLARAWSLYKTYCEQSNITYLLPRYRFRDEFTAYWEKFYPYKRINNQQYRSLYEGLKVGMFNSEGPDESTPKGDRQDTANTTGWLYLTNPISILDSELATQPAQYGSDSEKPLTYWDQVTTNLSDIDTRRLHFILPPANHVVIDFDIKDSSGKKSLYENVAAAAAFPKTYAEVSKGGQGLHLHYIYGGDVSKLSRVYDNGIEVLVPTGKFSIRRRLTMSNGIPIATISSGLPTKKEATVISEKVVKSERALRNLIARNLNKEIHAATKPSVDFISKVLKDADASGLVYDISDMQSAVVNFASNSTNNASECIKIGLSLPYKSAVENIESLTQTHEYSDPRIVFYDVEVFPNLLLICWKFQGEESKVQRMFNPSPEDIGSLLKFKLVGFNNRRYDNHILYGRYLGLTIYEIYQLSKKIISNDRSALFREAYRLSYADVFDYASKKQSLKKWQLELNILHKELDLSWESPVDPEKWDVVAEYCDNDVYSLEVVSDHLTEDFYARQILAELSGLTVNDSTLSHTSRIIFGTDRHPQDKFNYTNLSKDFPGYVFHRGVSTYRGETVGEGGYVWSKPGIYTNVLYMDVESMHPNSIELLNLFGPYTKNYTEIKDARMAIKWGKLDIAKNMFGGRLKNYIGGDMKALSHALKIVINIVYGVTFASFDNPFKDPRNIDNIVAKRGALFMMDLKYALEEQGIEAVHFKTDSVKIAEHKPEDIEFIKDFGLRYGYKFAVEDVFETMALLNDADLIGRSARDGEWVVVGARMKKPYVFKTLFSKEPILFEDMVESRAVTSGAIYLDMGNEDQQLIFIGKVGSFCPVTKDKGGTLLRIKDGKRYAVAGTKGFYWLPSYMVKNSLEDHIDLNYFRKAVDDALNKMTAVGDITDILDQ